MSDFFKYGSQGKEIDINQFKKELETTGAKESDIKKFFNFIKIFIFFHSLIIPILFKDIQT